MPAGTMAFLFEFITPRAIGADRGIDKRIYVGEKTVT